jgi:hypothetical protein
MRRLLWSIPLMLLAAAAALLLLSQQRGDANAADKKKESAALPPGWYANYDQALARAKATGQPLLVLFH